MSTETTSIIPQQASTASLDLTTSALDPNAMQRQINLIQQHMQRNMKEGEHFGKIPGCGDKPALLKSGAEKLCFIFQFAAEFDVKQVDLAGGHREYQVTCRLVHRPSGRLVGSGVGCCSTMESKYRFRVGAGEKTSIGVPKEFWDCRADNPQKAAGILKALANENGIEGDKFGTAKNESGMWVITTKGDRVEHDNPADYFNTCLKMAKKRAHVDATLTSTAASDIFAQDIEEMAAENRSQPSDFQQRPKQSQPAAAAPPADHDRSDPNWWQKVVVHFGEKLKGKSLGELPDHTLRWFQTEWLAKAKGSNRRSANDNLLMDAVIASMESVEQPAEHGSHDVSGLPDLAF